MRVTTIDRKSRELVTHQLHRSSGQQAVKIRRFLHLNSELSIALQKTGTQACSNEHKGLNKQYRT